MDRARYFRLQAGEGELTADEQKEWHFCLDWDGMLIHKDDEEFKCCMCSGLDLRAIDSSGSWRKPMSKQTQKTPKGHEIPIPKRGDFLTNLKKAATPAKGQYAVNPHE